MPLKLNNAFGSSKTENSFNMTPIIDIVFLLIIFFMVVSQFIEAENFPVAVPDSCNFAQTDTEQQTQIITVTVMKTDRDENTFAVGSEIINASESSDIVEQLANLIDAQLRELPDGQRIVTLRVDKDICFQQAQYALAAIAESTATDIKLAALKEKRIE